MTDELILDPDVKQATIAKLKAEERFYNERANTAVLENWSGERMKKQLEASSDSARIFPFYGAVNKGAVAGCMDTLTQWNREDPDKPITVVFNSPGGSVIDGLALYDQIQILKNEGQEINTHSLGMAASMGGILLQAGEKRTMGKHAYLLIHEISSIALGNASELEDELKFVQRLQARSLAILAHRSTLTPRQIARKWKRKDWWLDADEALELGFIDAIAE